MAEKDVLLNFKIDTGESVQSIDRLRAENRRLTQERNKVNISTEEGRKEVEKLNASIDKNTNLIKTNSTALEKQRLNVGNYSKSIEEAAGNINIAGQNTGQLTAKLSALASPVGIAVGLFTALGAAYARSSIGAKDLEFAQNQLSASVTIITDKFAGLFSSVEDGEGALSKLLNTALKFSIIGITDALGLTNIVEDSRNAALAQQTLDGILEDRGLILAANNELLAENAELLTTLTDTTQSLSVREAAAIKIKENAAKASKDIIASLKAEKAALEAIKVEKDDGALNKQKADLETRITAEQTKAKRLSEQATKALAAAKKLDAAETERVRKEVEKFLQTVRTFNPEREAAEEKASQERAEKAQQFLNDLNVDTLSQFDRFNSLTLTKVQIAEQSKREEIAETTEFMRQQEDQRLQVLAIALGQASALFNENTVAYKIIATADAVINTYRAANLALASFPPPFGAIAAGVSIATGLANVARIQGAQFAEGGFTGHGHKYETAGVVHKGEWVAPQEMVQSPKFRPIIQNLEANRRGLKGYADGGLVTNTSTAPINQNLLMMNAIKRMPRPEVSVKEISKVMGRVEVKQNISRI